MARYLVGIVMVICAILLFIINQGQDFIEVEDSLVTAYVFLIGGFIYIVFKFIRKR
ncbi:hypothetical protein [Neobacillus sp. SuZ13]|uniref:hypothetical protein n=1 Tax=Neobacillus sp. SuZ13 TaxID=3047875 RepID=UPI0024BFBE6A|nr:hypothetical protein [Neobacillus sp. SuZ13]WHY69599.1 hypothetical protein QNH17_13605 [Neobacillus sp. SuZ13]